MLTSWTGNHSWVNDTSGYQHDKMSSEHSVSVGGGCYLWPPDDSLTLTSPSIHLHVCSILCSKFHVFVTIYVYF